MPMKRCRRASSHWTPCRRTCARPRRTPSSCMPKPEPDDIGQLYALPLAEFTSARNARAAELRKHGDRAGSEVVKTLAKPTLTAWALNQVAHNQPRLVARLLEAGDDLRKAQQRLLAGAGQQDFRAATQAERAAATAVVAAAAKALGEAGHKPAKATLDRLESSAVAAAADPEAAALLRAGRPTVDLEP